MARRLSDIPLGTPIVDRFGAILNFMRLRWQELQDAFGQVPTVGNLQKLNQSAAIATTAVFTTTDAGRYRVSWYVRKTAIDGVSSSLQLTVGWQDHAVALTEAQAAVNTDALTAHQGGSLEVYADAESDITVAMAYTSNTPGNMKYALYADVEQLI